jgi:dynein heavy chain
MSLICAQGLFERHKLIVAAQLCISILKRAGKLQQDKLDFLVRGPKITTAPNQLKDWLQDSAWTSVQALKVCQ